MEESTDPPTTSSKITTKADIERSEHASASNSFTTQEKWATPVSKKCPTLEAKRDISLKTLQRSTSIDSSTSAIQVYQDVDQFVAALPSTSQNTSSNTGSEDGDQTQSQSQQCHLLQQDSGEGERSCWICFASDEDNRLAAWVQPCKCRGSTKWVHQSCLYRWVDEKQKGNALRTVSCQQCQTEYIIVFPQMDKIANILEAFDNLIKRVSPFLAAGIFVGSLYWTAVTYGAVTFLQA